MVGILAISGGFYGVDDVSSVFSVLDGQANGQVGFASLGLNFFAIRWRSIVSRNHKTGSLLANVIKVQIINL